MERFNSWKNYDLRVYLKQSRKRLKEADSICKGISRHNKTKLKEIIRDAIKIINSLNNGNMEEEDYESMNKKQLMIYIRELRGRIKNVGVICKGVSK